MIDANLIPRSSFIGRLARLPLRLIPPTTVVRVASGPARGLKWVSGSSVHGCWIGIYEREKQRALASALDSGDVFYDVGAHVGFYSILASRKVGRTGHVVAIEPFAGNIASLRRHVALNDLSNIQIVEAAAGEASGEARFRQAGASQMGRVDPTGGDAVAMVCIDDLVAAGAPAPDVVKIDVEGHELAVLRGAARTLRAHRPTVFLATHGDEERSTCLALLAELGYEVAPLASTGPVSSDELVATPPAGHSHPL